MRSERGTVTSRVRQLLDEHGLAQKDLAALLQIDEDKVSKSMNDRRRFTSLELALIAERFAVSVNWLLGIDKPAATVAARYSGSHVRTDELEEKLSIFAETRAALTSLGVPNEVPTLLVDENDLPLWVDQGTRMAEEAWNLLDKDDAADLSPGSFIDTIERVFNVDVALIPFDDGCDGLAWRQGDVAVIAAATTGVIARQRFTLAHELCHVLASDSQDLHYDENVFAGSRQPSEVRANAFAAAFLIPHRDLALQYGHRELTRSTFAEMVMDLAVSPSSLSWRLFNVNMIDTQAERRSLGSMSLAQCADITGRHNDLAQWVSSSTSVHYPNRLAKDALTAYLEGKTTLRLLARLVDIPTDQLRHAIVGALEEEHEDPEA